MTRAITPRLSLMMFLQFSIWGSWAVLIAGHMQVLGFSGKQISYVFGSTALGAVISPLIAGWIADRLMPAQIFTAISHFLGGLLLIVAWHQTAFAQLWATIFFAAIVYMPTIALTNAIVFHHIGDSDKFGNIRVWGTVGWIAINWMTSLYLRYWEMRAPVDAYLGDCLLFAAGCSFAAGFYSLTLPNTPPAKSAKNPYAFLGTLSLVSNRNFGVILIISFIVAVELPFYYNLTFLFLTESQRGIGLAPSTANWAMSIGQIAEVLVLLLLGPSLRRFGMRGTIFLGILAWPVRYAIFAIGEPTWLVIASQSLHGICFSFFFVGGMIAVEKLSPTDIRASSQALLMFATHGVGMLLGHFLSGRIHDLFAMADGGHDWVKIFLVPIAITLFAAAAFWYLFDERRYQDQSLGLVRSSG